MTSSLPNFLRINRIRIAKIALVLGLTVLVVLVPLLLMTWGTDWLKGRLHEVWWLVPAGLLALLAAEAPMVYLMIVRRLESDLLKEQRRYHRTLITASSGMVRVKDIQQLCQLIAYMVNRTVRLSHAGIFLYYPKEQRYILRAVRHKTMMPTQLHVEIDDPLIEMLQRQRDLIILDELQADMNLAKVNDEEARKQAWVYSWMRKLEIKLVVPSFSSERLLAFLVLGGKRSGQGYTTDDIAIFAGLANQAALAIENAMVFEELRTNEAYMIQSEKLASLGQLASGMAHEIHNPLTIISGEAQLYLERFKDQDTEAHKVLESIIEECRRAADITRRILRFSKPAQADMVPFDIKVTLEEVLMLAGYQVRLERVERTMEIQQDLPKVLGNQNQIQEVLLNLILNACQAMGEEGGRLFLMATSASGSHVELKVADNGPGIPPNKLLKIFDPFYTTKQTGTGLGLFVSQRIMQSHGGTIDVKSEEGKGTCFTIQLPVWREDAAEVAEKSA